MTPKTTLSVIIVNWNTAQITCQCLLSISKYLAKLNPEIILVDNGSTDDSLKKIVKLKIPNLIIIKNPKNYGFAKANNIGAKKAQGEFLFFINSDIILKDDKFHHMLSYFQHHPNLGLIAPQFLNPDYSLQPSVFPDQSVLNAIKEFWFAKSNSFTKYLPHSLQPSLVHSVSGGAILISKYLFINIGLWSERYFMYYEDLDLCRRINKTGLKICYYPDFQVIHYHGSSGQQLVNSQNQWKRLIPGSITYHGLFKHYLLYAITWISQKFTTHH